MQILVTNDDGITADGMNAVGDALSEFHEVTIVAPDSPRSSCSHHVAVAEPIRLREVSSNKYSISGFPADCVRIALQHLNLKPDLVVSGINHGGNLGSDILMSGTVAAAKEAALHGCPAIAVSQYKRPGCEVSWKTSANRFCGIVDQLAGQIPTSKDAKIGFWNVNLPAKPDSEQVIGFVKCEPDTQPLPYDYSRVKHGVTDNDQINVTELVYECNYQSRSRSIGSDVDVCFGGKISASYFAVFPSTV